MSSPAPRHRYSYADYLALEGAANTKHEYLDGEIYAMTSGTPEHAALAVAVSGELFAQLRGGPCRVYSSDLRVRVLETGLATYPDVTVLCGPVERDPDSPTTVVNPTLVVEVTSDGTEDYDCGEKPAHYMKVPSLREVVLISHSARRVEVFRREDGGWQHRTFTPPARAALTSVGCELDVGAIYRTHWGRRSSPPGAAARGSRGARLSAGVYGRRAREGRTGT
jgi:Uma2 family endonuclease